VRTYCPYCNREVKFSEGGRVVRCWSCRQKYYLPAGDFSFRRMMASARQTATVVGVVALVVVLWAAMR